MKHSLINDIINIVVPEEFPDIKSGFKGGVSSKSESLGGFIPLVDNYAADKSRPTSSKSRKG
jgi:hypothetical protein